MCLVLVNCTLLLVDLCKHILDVEYSGEDIHELLQIIDTEEINRFWTWSMKTIAGRVRMNFARGKQNTHDDDSVYLSVIFHETITFKLFPWRRSVRPCSALTQQSEVLLWNVLLIPPLWNGWSSCALLLLQLHECNTHRLRSYPELELNWFLLHQEALKWKLDSPPKIMSLLRNRRKNNLNCELNSSLPAAIYVGIVQWFLFSPVEDSPL